MVWHMTDTATGATFTYQWHVDDDGISFTGVQTHHNDSPLPHSVHVAGTMVGEAFQWSCKVQGNEIVSCSARMNGLAVSDGAYRGGGHHLGEFVGSGTFV